MESHLSQPLVRISTRNLHIRIWRTQIRLIRCLASDFGALPVKPEPEECTHFFSDVRILEPKTNNIIEKKPIKNHAPNPKNYREVESEGRIKPLIFEIPTSLSWSDSIRSYSLTCCSRSSMEFKFSILVN